MNQDSDAGNSALLAKDVHFLDSPHPSYNDTMRDDITVQAYMLAGLTETGQSVREQIYWDLQRYVVEEFRPWTSGIPVVVNVNNLSSRAYLCRIEVINSR